MIPLRDVNSFKEEKAVLSVSFAMSTVTVRITLPKSKDKGRVLNTSVNRFTGVNLVANHGIRPVKYDRNP